MSFDINNLRIGIIGLGYVGLPLAVEFGKQYPTVGFDIKTAEKNLLPLQPGDVPDTWADTEDLAADIGYQPSTTVEVGVQNFVEWYLAFYEQKT
jgi:nucleoside-diphosphate-sugar epimerase